MCGSSRASQPLKPVVCLNHGPYNDFNTVLIKLCNVGTRLSVVVGEKNAVLMEQTSRTTDLLNAVYFLLQLSFNMRQ